MKKKFFLPKKRITTKQSGFQLGVSCINQFLSIDPEIYISFDEGLEVCRIFLEIPKSFDTVWHKGLIFKLKQNGITGGFLNDVLSDFLSNSKQRIGLNIVLGKI